MEIPTFDTIAEKIDFVVANKSKLIAAKKAQIKQADGVVVNALPGKQSATKAASDTDSVIQRKLVINTTNWLDSHGDVHIKGLWKKSLSENKMIMLLQEHEMAFDKIISDESELKALTQDFTFKELGQNIEGTTEALVFDATIKQENNPYMFDRYAKNKVRNHSVGMQYVKLYLAVNSESYPEEKAIWDKYYPTVANKKRADNNGFFFAVTEAKVIEGSAVPIGSNTVTPTLEPDKSTPKHTEPSDDTLKTIEAIRASFKEFLT